MIFKQIVFVLIADILLAALIGCSSSLKISESPPSPATTENRELALEHFLQGSLLDQKGEYAKAILEYQDALKYTKDPAIYHSLAKDYALIGKLEPAVQNGKEAVRLEPDNRTYRETLAQIYIGSREIDSAIFQYQEIIRIDSVYENAWHTLARLQQLRSPEKALAIYRDIINRFGPDNDSYFQMVQIYTAQNKPDKAIEALRGMLELDPGNFEIKKMLGDFYLQQDSVDSALAIYDDLVETNPDNLELRAAIAHACLVKHDYDRAAEQFEIVMVKDTLSVEDQIRFGQVIVSFVQKDSAVAPYALALFEKIRDNHTNDWWPYWFLGAINNIVKDDSSALEHFRKVTELAKWNPDGWVGIAGVYYDKGKFDQAIEVLNEAKQYVKEEFRIYFLLGISYQRKNDNVEAVLALEKALQLNDRSVDAMTALAMTYDELKQHEESDSLYERALRLDPKNNLLLNNYSYSLAERGLQLERALNMAKEAVAQQPNNQSYLDTYGWVYYRLGDYEEAEKWIRKAIDLGSISPVIHEHLGDIYFKMSDRDRAMLYWQKALDLDSANEHLREKIQRGKL